MPVMVMLSEFDAALFAPYCREAPLALVSVVNMASAASGQLLSLRAATAAGMPLSSLSIGRGSPITPVENGSICSLLAEVAAARASQLCSASSMPCSPVPALALPVFTIRYFGVWLARCCLATMTGAAQKAFCVNSPAAVLPSAISMTNRSLRPGVLIPALAMPSLKPVTGCMVGSCPLPVAILLPSDFCLLSLALAIYACAMSILCSA